MRGIVVFPCTFAFAVAATAASGQRSFPDLTRTPGAVNPDVTQETIATTICRPGWTESVRPPEAYTSALKRQQLAELAYADRRPDDYEEDPLIPLSLGGAPSDPRNLWPEPRQPADGWTVDMKSKLEVTLSKLVCAGAVSLADAQQAIALDWRAAYWRFVQDPR